MAMSISDALNKKQAMRSFCLFAGAYPIAPMKTIAEIRLQNLELLVDEFGTSDKVAAKADTSPVYLSQLRNKTPDSKTGKLRQIGDPLARKLETGCGKELGWMDNQHYPSTHRSRQITQIVRIMEHMEDWQLDQATKIIDTIAQPAPKRSNGDS